MDDSINNATDRGILMHERVVSSSESSAFLETSLFMKLQKRNTNLL